MCRTSPADVVSPVVEVRRALSRTLSCPSLPHLTTTMEPQATTGSSADISWEKEPKPAVATNHDKDRAKAR